MEKLEITGNIRRNLHKDGNTVLITEFPTLSGDTPAVAHTKALFAALWEFAKGPLSQKAADALFCAVKSGKLASFTPYKMTVSLTKKEGKRAVLLTLTLTIRTNEETHSVTRRFLFTADEALRKGRGGVRVRRRKARKNA